MTALSTQLKKGQFIVIDANHERIIPFMFNPTEVKETYGVKYRYTKHDGQFLPAKSLVSYDQIPIKFTLFLYGRLNERAYLERKIAEVLTLVLPGEGFSAENPFGVSPGAQHLVLGPNVWHGSVTTVGLTRSMFDEDLNTTVAYMDIIFVPTSLGINADAAFAASLRARAGFY